MSRRDKQTTLKNLIDPPKNNVQNSCNTGKKIKGVVQSGNSEETTVNILVLTQDLKKDNDLNFGKQKEKPMELHGEFKTLIPPMYDGDSGKF